MASSSTKILVGVDFGTTYSGVAFTSTHPTRKDQPPLPITVWPVSLSIVEGQSSSKVPTRVLYDGDGVKWGFSVPSSLSNAKDQIKESFKLGLEPGLLGKCGLTGVSVREAEKLATDYMTALLEHTFYMISRKLGLDSTRLTPFEFVVTVPAIWSERAKDATLRAAQAAANKIGKGTSPILLVSEPEAAAMYALHGLKPHGLEIGDTFMVCDAGGGTVDLVTYTITKLEPTLQIRETAPGIGEIGGSRFLDEEFRKFFRERFSHMPDFDNEVLEDAVQHFEQHVKREVTLSSVTYSTLAINAFGLPDDRELGIRRGRFHMKASDMFKVFEPVVSSVVKLVDDQLAASDVNIKAVLLVGGFGASNYLRERLENHLRAAHIQVMQPPNSWLAVTLGAVMKGVAACAPEQAAITVSSRQARKHYGLELNEVFSDTRHSSIQNRRHWDHYDGCWRVTIMHWFLERGTSVTERGLEVTSFGINRKVSSGPLGVARVTIYVDATDRASPMVRDGDVTELCTLQADLSHIPLDRIPQDTGDDGQLYYLYNFKVEAIFLSASTKYRIVHDGKKYDIVTAEYVGRLE